MEHKTSNRQKTIYLMIGSILLLLPGFFLAVSMGATKIGLTEIRNSIFAYSGSLSDMMIVGVRLPRAICALLTGGVLGITGAMMQGVTRNPIAEPSLLGISQGATLIVACLYAANMAVTTPRLIIAALLGAFLICIIIVGFTMRNPGNASITRLLLAGTALSSLFVSLTTIVGLLSNRSQMIAFWVSGGFREVTWTEVIVILGAAVPGFLLAWLLSGKINILSLGDDVAIGLGENPNRVRLVVMLLMIPLCAATVVVGRTIGFVGLIIPQSARLIVGEDYRRIIPCSFLMGAVLLTYADIAARMINTPYETPIGIFTAMIGVPFFLYMARKEKG
ncbi:MAG: iron ABC transporter permease [Acetatifactor sp.]|nr:iron ABC transporter permease [Acetatifactor sp.]